MEFMNEAGLTIWLDVSMERLIPRLILGRAKRPLLAGKSDDELLHFVYNALEARRPFYSGAQSVFCSDFLENQEEIDRTVAEFVNRYSLPIKSDCKI